MDRERFLEVFAFNVVKRDLGYKKHFSDGAVEVFLPAFAFVNSRFTH